jgi:hypothetical protein
MIIIIIIMLHDDGDDDDVEDTWNTEKVTEGTKETKKYAG